MQVPDRPPLHALTSIRFFAAMHIVLYHFLIYVPGFKETAPDWVQRLIATGPMQVCLFFVLSGFILTYNYMDLDASLRVNKREFWAVRFARIYPMYLIGMVAYLPIAAGRYLSGTGLSVIDVGPAPTFYVSGILSLLLLQAWVFVFSAWNPPSWSISAECFFYFLFPWAAPRITRCSTRRIFSYMSAFWLISMAAPAFYLIAILGHSSKQTKELWDIGLETFPLLRLMPYLVGIGTGVLFLREPDRDSARYSALINITLLGIAILCVSLPTEASRLLESVVTVPFALLVYLLAFRRGTVSRLLSMPWMVTLGDASYAMYLFHTAFWNYFARLPNIYSIVVVGHFPVGLAKPGVRTEWNYQMNGWVFCVYLVTLILISLWVTQYVERPIRLYVRRRLLEPRRRVAVAAAQSVVASMDRA